MKSYIKRLFAPVLLILVITLTSCALFIPNDRFVGGEFLDDNKMAEIKEEIFSTGKTETSTGVVTETETETTDKESEVILTETPELKEPVVETEKINEEEATEATESIETVVTIVTENEEISATEVESETEAKGTEEVFWTKSGTVWHIYSDCSHIRNSGEVICGSVEEAVSAGKSKLCTNCEKRQNP